MSRSRKLELAKKNALSFKLMENSHKGEISEENYFSIGTSIEEVGCGVSTSCYISLVKHLAIFFFIATLIAAGSAVLYTFFYDVWKEKGERRIAEILVWISLGNIGNGIWKGTADITNRKYFYILLAPELAFSLFFIIFFCYMRRNLKSMALKTDRAFISAGDFSLMVEGIPKSEKSAKAVFTHFNQISPVHSVLLCYDCREVAELQKAINEVVAQYCTTIECSNLALAVEDINKCSRSVGGNGGGSTSKEKEDVREQVSRQILNRLTHYHLAPDERVVNFLPIEDENPGCFSSILRFFGWRKDIFYRRDQIISLLKERQKTVNPEKKDTTGIAFVIFRTASGARKVRERYQKETSFKTFGGAKDQSHDLKYPGEHILRVKAGVEPSDIDFANLGYSSVSVFFRSLFADFITLYFVAVGVCIFLITADQKQLDNVFRLSIVTSLVVNVLNNLLINVIPALNFIRKPRTRTAMVSGSFVLMSLTNFLLSSLATFVLSGSLDASDESRKNMIITEGMHYFMSVKWYNNIAVNFLFNIMVDIMIGFFFDITNLSDRVFEIFPAWLCAGSLPQDELNRAYIPPEWPLEEKMAQTVHTVLTGLLICPMMPITIPILAIYFFLRFWVDKYELLRWFQRPTQYGFDLVQNAVTCIFIGFHLHCLVKILAWLAVVFVNDTRDACCGWSFAFSFSGIWGSFDYLNALFHALFYVLFVIGWLVWRLCDRRSSRKEGQGGKQAAAEEGNAGNNSDDETGGKPFDLFENFVETFLDKHPCYNESDAHCLDEMDRRDYKDSLLSRATLAKKVEAESVVVGTGTLTETKRKRMRLDERERGLETLRKITPAGKEGLDTSPIEGYRYYAFYTAFPTKQRSLEDIAAESETIKSESDCKGGSDADAGTGTGVTVSETAKTEPAVAAASAFCSQDDTTHTRYKRFMYKKPSNIPQNLFAFFGLKPSGAHGEEVPLPLSPPSDPTPASASASVSLSNAGNPPVGVGGVSAAEDFFLWMASRASAGARTVGAGAGTVQATERANDEQVMEPANETSPYEELSQHQDWPQMQDGDESSFPGQGAVEARVEESFPPNPDEVREHGGGQSNADWQ